jgi:hypothetical protein
MTKEIKNLAEIVRQEGEAKLNEAKAIEHVYKGDKWIADEVSRRGAALILAASILERIGQIRRVK